MAPGESLPSIIRNVFYQWEYTYLHTDDGNSRISVSGTQMPSCDVMIQICVKRKWTSVIRSEPAIRSMGRPSLTFTRPVDIRRMQCPCFSFLYNLLIPARECQHRFTALRSFLQQNTCATRFYRPTRASRSINDPLEDPQS